MLLWFVDLFDPLLTVFSKYMARHEKAISQKAEAPWATDLADFSESRGEPVVFPIGRGYILPFLGHTQV